MEQQIKSELIRIGYNPIHRGTIYLSKIINMLYDSDKSVLDLNLEKDFYFELSKSYKISAKTIKSDIAKATNCVNSKKLSSNPSYNVSILDDIKLTPKLAVCIVVDRLRQ